MFVSVFDRPSVAEPTETQDRVVMESRSATIHRKMPILARQLPITGSAHKAGVVGDSEVAAVIAAIDVAAQRRRPAVLNRRHHLQLVEAETPDLSETVAGTHGPEDIGDLQRGGPHKASAAGRPRVGGKYPELVERAGHGAHRPRRHLGVEGGGVQLGVSERTRGIMQSVFSLASRRETGGESALQWIATVS
jgi:hypothetical protein